jgi:S-adenosylmethionine:tRNA ribosyltransferase-isomerase
MNNSPAFDFALPDSLNAWAPPERRGLRRDQVRLLLLNRVTGEFEHGRFDQLGEYLKAGDLLVLNNSRTLPAVLQATGTDGVPVEIRLAHRLSDTQWRALLVSATAPGAGARLLLPEGLVATVAHQHPGEPLQEITFSRGGWALYDTIYRIGQPVRYEYLHEPWDLDYYQTVFASVPGSVEMPSAGRPFTWQMLFGLKQRGVGIAYLSLHAGLSYFLDENWPMDPRYTPEEYHIPAETVRAIGQAKESGGRVIAVGTTVVRALESATQGGALLASGRGWADIFIDQQSPLQVVDGLLTGLHEPEASHLDLLSAFMAPTHLHAAYLDAVRQGYLWHEFGDMNLIL